MNKHLNFRLLDFNFKHLLLLLLTWQQTSVTCGSNLPVPTTTVSSPLLSDDTASPLTSLLSSEIINQQSLENYIQSVEKSDGGSSTYWHHGDYSQEYPLSTEIVAKSGEVEHRTLPETLPSAQAVTQVQEQSGGIGGQQQQQEPAAGDLNVASESQISSPVITITANLPQLQQQQGVSQKVGGIYPTNYQMNYQLMDPNNPGQPPAAERIFMRHSVRKRTRLPVYTNIYSSHRVIPHGRPRGRARRGRPRRAHGRRRPRGRRVKRRRRGRGKRPPPKAHQGHHAHSSSGGLPAYAPAFVSYGPVFGPPPTFQHLGGGGGGGGGGSQHGLGSQQDVRYIPVVHSGPGPAAHGHHIVMPTSTYSPLTGYGTQPSYVSPGNSLSSQSGGRQPALTISLEAESNRYHNHAPPHGPHAPRQLSGVGPMHNPAHRPLPGPGQYSGPGPMQGGPGGFSAPGLMPGPGPYPPAGNILPGPGPMMGSAPGPGYGSLSASSSKPPYPVAIPIPVPANGYPHPTNPPPGFAHPPRSGNLIPVPVSMPSNPPYYSNPGPYAPSPSNGVPYSAPHGGHHSQSQPPGHGAPPQHYGPVNLPSYGAPTHAPPMNFGHPMHNFGPPMSNYGQPPPIMGNPVKDNWAPPTGYNAYTPNHGFNNDPPKPKYNQNNNNGNSNNYNNNNGNSNNYNNNNGNSNNYNKNNGNSNNYNGPPQNDYHDDFHHESNDINDSPPPDFYSPKGKEFGSSSYDFPASSPKPNFDFPSQSQEYTTVAPPRRHRKRRPKYNNNNDYNNNNNYNNNYNSNNNNNNNYNDGTESRSPKNTYWAGESNHDENSGTYWKEPWGKYHQREVKNKNNNKNNNYNRYDDGNKYDYNFGQSKLQVQPSQSQAFEDVEVSSYNSKSNSNNNNNGDYNSFNTPRKRYRHRSSSKTPSASAISSTSSVPGVGRPAPNYDTNYNSPGMSKDPKVTDWMGYGDYTATEKLKMGYPRKSRRKPTKYSTLPKTLSNYQADPTHEKYPNLTYDSLIKRILPEHQGPKFLDEEAKSRTFETGTEFKKMLSDHDSMRI